MSWPYKRRLPRKPPGPLTDQLAKVQAGRVYRHVIARLDTGLLTGRDDRNPYGSSAVGRDAGLTQSEVEAAMMYCQANGWLIYTPGTGVGKNRTPGHWTPGHVSPLPDLVEPQQPTALAQAESLAERLGLITKGRDPEPITPLDWALHWSRRGLHVFPAQRFLGTPLVARWHSEATTRLDNICEWWSTWPEADTAVVPDKSGRFAVVGAIASLEEEFGELVADFRFINRWDEEHLLVRGAAITSHRDGVHVLGAGHYVYMPASWAPNPDWR